LNLRCNNLGMPGRCARRRRLANTATSTTPPAGLSLSKPRRDVKALRQGFGGSTWQLRTALRANVLPGKVVRPLYIPESEVDGRFHQEFKAMVESIKFLP
jgi:hypothetical protein